MNPPAAPGSKGPARSVIWVASYPKSGNTWVQNVIRTAGRDFGFPTTDIDVYKMKRDGRRPVVVSGVRARLNAERPTVLKTHSMYRGNRTHAELGLKIAGFVYVIRNPLDVLLSYINFSRIQYANRKEDADYQYSLFVDLLGMEQPIPFDQWQQTTLDDLPRANLDHALQRYTDNATAVATLKAAGGSWLEHARSWIDASTTVPSVVLRYEDLIQDKVNFRRLSKLFRFSEELILQAVSDVQQRSLRSKSDGGARIFLNKMTSYYYTDYFSEPLIRAFLDRFGDELTALGYADLPAGGDPERHP